MATVFEVVNFFKNLANNGQGVDKDGAYGYQCADVTTFAAKNWFGVDLWGNAADLLGSAEAQGWEVVYMPTEENPRAGAFFVKNFVANDGINYGHTGLVIADSDGVTMETIEQNLAGDLEYGSPAEFHLRNFDGIAGWFYPPYEEGGAVPPVQVGQVELVAETGTFTVSVEAINVRRAPSLKGEVVASYKEGQSVLYDSKCTAEGNRWISYVGESGKRNYMAIGEVDQAGNRTSLWGKLT